MNEARKHIFNAIEYIESNLRNDLSISIVCKKAFYSLYHFQRIFSSMTGMSLATYIRRRRLTLAAAELIATRKRIIEIALESGFESQEAFSRAFKKMYQSSPGAFRRRGFASPGLDQIILSKSLLIHLQGGVTMEPEIMEMDEFWVIGMQNSYRTDKPNEIPRLWDQFISRIDEITDRDRSVLFGICYSKLIDGAPCEDFEYTASAKVLQSATPPEGMVKIHIPKNRYAVFTHRGPITKLQETVKFIWGSWIPQSKYKLVDSPDFELYDRRFNPETMSGELDIYVPIKE
jgi:AraC family transcriptional regulator